MKTLKKDGTEVEVEKVVENMKKMNIDIFKK